MSSRENEVTSVKGNKTVHLFLRGILGTVRTFFERFPEKLPDPGGLKGSGIFLFVASARSDREKNFCGSTKSCPIHTPMT